MGSCPDNISRTTMKFFLAVILPFIWGALASVNANLATETFSQIIKIGKTKGKCTFSLSYTNTSPKTKSTRQTISAPSGFVFEITLRINKPNSKILGAEILQVPDTTTTTSTTTRKTTTITTTTKGAEETTTPTRSGKEVTEESLPGAWVWRR